VPVIATKVVLCFGDSNTWGLDPATEGRFDLQSRWTGVLQACLGPGFRVLEEGLNNRTTNLDDPINPDRNGARQLTPCLDSHRPVDLVIVMLGTNDLKARFARSPSDIAESAARLAGEARRSLAGPCGAAPAVLLVCPVPILELGAYREMYVGGEAKARELSPLYQRFAAWHGVPVFDAGSVAVVSELDGVHLDRAAHARLGRALAERARALIDPGGY
jgi:lysophospholipase L1-like esterase